MKIQVKNKMSNIKEIVLKKSRSKIYENFNFQLLYTLNL